VEWRDFFPLLVDPPLRVKRIDQALSCKEGRLRALPRLETPAVLRVAGAGSPPPQVAIQAVGSRHCLVPHPRWHCVLRRTRV